MNLSKLVARSRLSLHFPSWQTHRRPVYTFLLSRLQVSYSAASSALSNRVVFPYFYRTYMPDPMLNRARVRLIKEFGWQRIATIHENQDLFSLVGAEL